MKEFLKKYGDAMCVERFVKSSLINTIIMIQTTKKSNNLNWSWVFIYQDIMVKYFITRIVIVSMAILFNNIVAVCQKHDYNWLFGFAADAPGYEIIGSDTLLWGATNFDFNHDPVRIYRDKNRYTDFLETNASYSTEDGRLFSYSNGHHIYAADDGIIEGGDSTLYGAYWELWVDKNEVTGWGFDRLAGLVVPQSILYVPSPADKNKVYMINQFLNFNPQKNKTTSSSLHYSLIDKEANDGKGLVIDKDIKILDTILCAGYVQATKHGNGRDWWITVIRI